FGSYTWNGGGVRRLNEFAEKSSWEQVAAPVEIFGIVLCITPIWRGDHLDELPVFYSFCENIKKTISSYPNVKVIEGLTLVPHLEEYYLDNLHPNVLGTETYAANLVKEMKKIGF
ncbi:MAG: hypothetical protein IIX95_07625, partial [Clostridiales bacterium]|nr:hypothetical protein [Clostridiales bacterium]